MAEAAGAGAVAGAAVGVVETTGAVVGAPGTRADETTLVVAGVVAAGS